MRSFITRTFGIICTFTIVTVTADICLASDIQTFRYTTKSNVWNYEFIDSRQKINTGLMITFDECYGILDDFDVIESKYGISEDIIVVRAGSKMHVSFPENGIKGFNNEPRKFSEFKESTDMFNKLKIANVPFGTYLVGSLDSNEFGDPIYGVTKYNVDITPNKYNYTYKYFGLFPEENGTYNYDYEGDNGIWIKLKNGFIDYHLTFNYDFDATYPPVIMDWNSPPLKPVLALTDEQVENILQEKSDTVTLDYTVYCFNSERENHTVENKIPVTVTKDNYINGLYDMLSGNTLFSDTLAVRDMKSCFSTLIKLPNKALSLFFTLLT